MSKHTPGPWEQGDGSDRNLFCGSGDILGAVRPGTRGVVARVNPGIIDSLANASLIAAAPDLLESLYMAVKYLKGENMGLAMLPKFEAAISKAEGRNA